MCLCCYRTGAAQAPEAGHRELSCILGPFCRTHSAASLSSQAGRWENSLWLPLIGTRFSDGCSGLHICSPHPWKGSEQLNEVVILNLPMFSSFLEGNWTGWGPCPWRQIVLFQLPELPRVLLLTSDLCFSGAQSLPEWLLGTPESSGS